MKVSVQMASLRGTRWTQYAVRFVLGGLVTVMTGWIAKQFGPAVGGLFLAFPAIFPAGATLIAKREEQKKARKGLHGKVRGRRAAALDAAGAVLGAVGLVGFGVLVWKGLPQFGAAITLCLAMAGWLVIALPLWWLRKSRPWRRR
jgi:uncharacterized protein DUF3147